MTSTVHSYPLCRVLDSCKPGATVVVLGKMRMKGDESFMAGVRSFSLTQKILDSYLTDDCTLVLQQKEKWRLLMLEKLSELKSSVLKDALALEAVIAAHIDSEDLTKWADEVIEYYWYEDTVFIYIDEDEKLMACGFKMFMDLGECGRLRRKRDGSYA